MKIRENIVKLQKETTSPALKDAASRLLEEFTNIDGLKQTPPMNEAFKNAKYKEFVDNLNEMDLNESDKAGHAFKTRVNNELTKELITENLGISDAINKLQESNFANLPTLKYLVEGFSKNLGKPEYMLVESYMNTFGKFSYIPVIRDSFNHINENVKKYEKDILLYSTLDNLGNKKGFASANFVLENYKTEIDNYLANRTESAKNRLVESLSKFTFDRGVKRLIDVLNTVNESNGFDINGFSASCDVSNVHSLIFENEGNYYFNIGQSLYMFEGEDPEAEELEEGNSPTLDNVKPDDLKLVTVDDVEKIAEGHDYLLNVDFILRRGVNISENLVTIPYGKGGYKSIKIYEAEVDDEEDDLILDESTKMSVIDQNAAIKDLKKIGVDATPDSKDKDIIIINKVKDKKKMKDWLENAGWDGESVKEIMPELHQAVYEGEDAEEKDPEIVVEMDGEKMDIDKVEESLTKGSLITPSDREVAAFVKRIYENFNNFGKIDIAKKFTSKVVNNQSANVFKIDETFYIHKFDGINNVQVFESVNALTARDTIFEFLGYDISESFDDLIQKDINTVKVNEKLKAEFENNITKLEEQRDALLNHENQAVRTSPKIVAIVENLNVEIDKVKESYRLFNEGEEVSDDEMEDTFDDMDNAVKEKLQEAEDAAEEVIEEMKNFLAVKRMYEGEIDPEKSEIEEEEDDELQDEIAEAKLYGKLKSIFEADNPDEDGLNKEGEVDDKSIHSKNVGDKAAGGTVIAVDDAEGEATIALDAGGTKQIKEGEEAEEEVISEMRRFLAVRTLRKLTEGEEVEDGEEEMSEMRKFVTLKRIFESDDEDEDDVIEESKKFKYWKTISEALAEEGNEPTDKVDLEKEIIAEMRAYRAIRSMFESDHEDEDDRDEILDEMFRFLSIKSLFESDHEDEDDEEMKEAKAFLRLRKLAEGEEIEEEDPEKEAAIKETTKFEKMTRILESKLPEDDDEDELDEAEDNEGDSPEDAPENVKLSESDDEDEDDVIEEGEDDELDEAEDNEGDSPEDKPKEISESDDEDEDDVIEEGEDEDDKLDIKDLEEDEEDLMESITAFRKIKSRLTFKMNESDDEEEKAALAEECDKVEESINNLKSELAKVNLLIEAANTAGDEELSDKKTEISPKKKIGQAVTVNGQKGVVASVGGAEEVAIVSLDKGGSAKIAESEDEDEDDVIEEGLNVGDTVSYNGVDATVSGIADGMVTLTGNFEDGEQTITIPEGDVKGDVSGIGEE